MTLKEKIEMLKNVCEEAPRCGDCPLHENYEDSICSKTTFDKLDEKTCDEMLKSIGLLVENEINDPVNRPSHYTDGKIEVIDFIEDKKLGFCLGNAIKYIARAGKKNKDKEVEDLEKAIWYIKRRIKEIQEAKE